MTYSYDIIKSILRTEKADLNKSQGKYIFLVDRYANKIQVKHAVEQIYKVKVKDVNTFIGRGKLKRVRYQLGRTPDYKRAIVTLKEGQTIEVT